MSESDEFTPLTIACWLWRGKKPIYGPEHVHALKRMCEARIRPHRFICITDQPGVRCETYPLWDFPKVKRGNWPSLDCWRRLRLFDPDIGRQFGERILSIDLGVVIRDDITDLIDDSDFQAMNGRFSHINGGLFTMKTGTNPHVWDYFDPETAAELVGNICGSDQAWLSHMLPDVPVWTREHGIYRIQDIMNADPYPLDDRVRFIACPGANKPWNDRVRRKVPQVYNEYMEFYG